MIILPSRHDHFPAADIDRRARMRAAAAALVADWAAEDQAPDGVLAAMRAVERAPLDEAIAALAPWVADVGWLGARLNPALDLLAADCFTRPPLRPVGGASFGGLVLAEAGPIRLTLLLRPFVAAGVKDEPAPLFVPGRTLTHILAPGGAMARFHHVVVSAAEEAGAFTAVTASPCTTGALRPLVAGEMLALDTARTCFSFVGGDADMLMLELAVQPPSRLPNRAYEAASGRLAHVSASRRDSSFRGMALTLLRTLGRTDAAPLFAAESESEDFAARWSAMRELVALDPAIAQPHLVRMAAGDPHPEVRRAAAATLALYASQSSMDGPALARENSACPA